MNPDTLYPKNLADLTITPNAPTYQELTAILAHWLKQAEDDGKLQMLLDIARAWSIPGEKYPYSLHLAPYRYQRGRYTLHYLPKTALHHTNITLTGTFCTLVVTEGGTKPFELDDGFQHVCYTDGEFQEPGMERFYRPWMQKDNLYLPGAWEQEFYPHHKSALLTLTERERSEDMEKRNKLLARIGKEIENA